MTSVRFSFGKNWKNFSRTLDEDRVAEAVKSLKWMLGLESMDGLRFLDAGCGSGLFSLAARRLGASVVSFDYDMDSVECSKAVRSHYKESEESWRIEQGSVLDAGYLASLGKFDIVYSWGVLHHTGQMWRALELIQAPLKPGGILFISIYNNQGVTSRKWSAVKKTYCSGVPGRIAVLCACLPYFFFKSLAWDIDNLHMPGHMIRTYRRNRGMSIYHDWIDWLGGYPFETARPDEIFNYYRNCGFTLERIVTTNGNGTNQFVFRASANLPKP